MTNGTSTEMAFAPTEWARKQTEGWRVLVGIRSYRKNRDKRDAVRETWLGAGQKS